MAEKYLVGLGNWLEEVEVEETPEGVRVTLGGQTYEVRLEPLLGNSLYLLELDQRPTEIFAQERPGGYDIVIGPHRYTVLVQSARAGRPTAPVRDEEGWQSTAAGWLVLAPMSGIVSEVYVAAGQAVQEGDVLLVIESMKMNNELRARYSGTVREVHVGRGQRVEQGQPLLLLR